MTQAQIDRFADWQSQICSITLQEWNSHTIQEWTDWFSVWGNYCALGGTRPPNRPPI